MFNLCGKKGFSMMEMMIVVVIVAILATVGLPVYTYYTCRSRQSVAHAALKGLQLSEETFRSRNGAYTIDLIKLGNVPAVTANPPYQIKVTNASEVAFTGVAECKISDGCDIGGLNRDDVWQIDHLGNLTNVSNACSE